MRKARAGLVTGGLALLGIGFAAAPAQASTVHEPAASGGTAPACIARDVDNADGFATITNNCGKTMRVNVVISAGPDSGCFTLLNYESKTVQYLIGVYDKTVVC
jgi:hypothetical protein